MSQWSGGRRAFAIEAFLKGRKSYVVARRQFCSHYNIRRLRDGPSENLIRKWVIKFRATGSAINQPRPGPSRTSSTEEIINEVAASSIQPTALEQQFQQDGATCHTARATMDQLRELFPQKLISCFGDTAWPPRSPHQI
ncbi:unnamed protein product [Spodoptera littoralis]|uniref:DUF4817 domain-containing protein n=1 Tax=Spodoptera littoralis TaxID=7109 RepID=A0A9P0IDM6_SPOLI|nr:unnamed protein product [Spodoptera littoralis]CAH1644860.1 unnamed protein product [Spodoptera littoralis]